MFYSTSTLHFYATRKGEVRVRQGGDDDEGGRRGKEEDWERHYSATLGRANSSR